MIVIGVVGLMIDVLISRLERKETLGALNPARERLLEYDLARAVAIAPPAAAPRSVR